MKTAKVVLAYSGGLDTSVILFWLKEVYQCQTVAFIADLGQGEDLAAAAARAKAIGADKTIIADLRERLARDFILPMLRANAAYEQHYLLGTAIARPLIALAQVECARAEKADALSHGATGKGNDQIRFELGYAASAPEMKIIAPWREWKLASRSGLIAYARDKKIPLQGAREEEAPFSVDANLWHRARAGRILEDPSAPCPEEVWQWTASPQNAPAQAEEVEIEFASGDPAALNGEKLPPHTLIARLNTLAGRHGIGRADIVENRFTGMKSRGAYETPAGTLLLRAHRALEELTLDREAMHLKDELMPRYAALIYNGFWFAPERLMLQKLIDESQTQVSGVIRASLYKGTITIMARRSPFSLYSPQHATFEQDSVYRQSDAGGYIALNALRLKLAALARRGKRR